MIKRGVWLWLLVFFCVGVAACGADKLNGDGLDSKQNIGFGAEGGDAAGAADGSSAGDTSQLDAGLGQVLGDAAGADPGKTDPDPPVGCVPGSTQLCLCSPSIQGVQVCAGDNTWGDCECSETTTGVDTGSSPQDTQPDTNTSPPDDGASGETDNSECNERTKQVYLLSSTQQLLRFDPGVLKVTVVGTLNCPDTSTPFSMSVDNYANAWILYQPMLFGGGKLYKASTVDATCVGTSYTPGLTPGFELFGMGFAADAPGSNQETLFVTGGTVIQAGTSSNYNANLGSMKTVGLVLTSLATLTGTMGLPELTGTGTGELWGFYPSAFPPVVGQIDKTTGAILQSHDLSNLSVGGAMSYAFAAWGGDFYLFLKSTGDLSTNIWKVNGATGATTQVISNSGYSIVGAGVSTCAPTE